MLCNPCVTLISRKSFGSPTCPSFNVFTRSIDCSIVHFIWLGNFLVPFTRVSVFFMFIFSPFAFILQSKEVFLGHIKRFIIFVFSMVIFIVFWIVVIEIQLGYICFSLRLWRIFDFHFFLDIVVKRNWRGFGCLLPFSSIQFSSPLESMLF